MESEDEIGASIFESDARGDLEKLTENEIGASIFEAGARGDLEKLKELDDENVEFRSICDEYSEPSTGKKVLNIAAEMGQKKICKFLIEKVGVKIEVLTHKGDTPLIGAAKERNFKLVQYLIKSGALIQAADSDGLTSLHYAVLNGDMELVDFLLIKAQHFGLDCHLNSVKGTPLHCAASCARYEAVKVLLVSGAKPSISGVLGSPLICAIKSHSFESLDFLLMAEADPNELSNGFTALTLAAKEGDKRCLNRLIKAGADPNIPNTDGRKPIEEAALMNNREVVEILFPLTQQIQIPDLPEWSVDGIMRFHSPINKVLDNPELLELILVKLMVQDVVRFKALCKMWHNLISSSYFCHKHSLLNPPKSKKLILQIRGSSQFLIFDPSTKTITPYKMGLLYYNVVQESCGLLLLESDPKWSRSLQPTTSTEVNQRLLNRSYAVYNPVAREWRTISLMETASVRFPTVAAVNMVHSHGYKVVCLRRTDCLKENYNYQISIYDSNNKTWEVGSAEFSSSTEIKISGGLSFHNMIFWSASVGMNRAYLVFNMLTKKEQWLDLPRDHPNRRHSSRWCPYLQVLENRLYHIEYASSHVNAEIGVWEYVEGQWHASKAWTEEKRPNEDLRGYNVDYPVWYTGGSLLLCRDDPNMIVEHKFDVML